MKLETPEEQRFWLAVYEANAPHGLTGQQAAEVADAAVVEDWRPRVSGGRAAGDAKQAEETIARLTRNLDGARAESEGRRRLVELARQEIAQLQTECGEALRGRDKARALLDDVRTALKASKVPDAWLPARVAEVVAANAVLREDCGAIADALPPGEGTWAERVKALVKSLDALRDSWRMCAHPGCIQRDVTPSAGQLEAERNSLQEDLAAMKERLEAGEQQRERLRAILEAAGVRARGEACSGSGKDAVQGDGGALVCPECRQGPPWVPLSGDRVLGHRRQS